MCLIQKIYKNHNRIEVVELCLTVHLMVKQILLPLSLEKCYFDFL
jgi:hypothetical protein